MKKKHSIEFYEYNSKTSTLTYFVDGIQVDVTGEFYKDYKGYHHTHLFDDGIELELIF